jgi:uncharacterized protein YndB with AHSA1/START domain
VWETLTNPELMKKWMSDQIPTGVHVDEADVVWGTAQVVVAMAGGRHQNLTI